MTKNTDKLLAHVNTLRNNSMDYSSYMLERDNAYYRGEDKRVAKGDTVLPIVMSQVDSARAFLTTTFLAVEPIFSVVQHDAKLGATALMWNTLYENHSRRFGWKSQLSIAFNDTLKYGLCAIELTWHQETQELPSNSANEKASTILYQGNKLKRINLYEAFWDSAVPPSAVHTEGDYAGYHQVVSGTRLMRLLHTYKAAGELDIKALQAATSDSFTVSPSIAPSYTATGLSKTNQPVALLTPQELAAQEAVFPRSQEHSKVINGTRTYKLTTCYIRILPEEFELDTSTNALPRIYKLLVLNDKHLIVTQEQTNVHNYLPIVFGQALLDGLDYGSKSFGHNVEDIQQTASQLTNADIKAAKRAISDRGIYNPDLISKKDIENPNPSGKIPIKRSALGAKLSDAFYPFPFTDPAMGTRTQQAVQLSGYANLITGQNPVKQGQFVKGNKTDGQFQESMASSNERMFALAINLEDTLIYALKEMTKLNILQYQPSEDLVSRQLATSVAVDPIQLAKVQMEFSVADGLLTVDRLAKTDLTMQAVQMLGQLSASMQQPPQYDILGMIVHMLEQQNIKGLSQFKIAQQPQQQNAPIQDPQPQ